MQNFANIHSVAAKLFHAARRTDIHDETSSHLSQFCEHVLKKLKPVKITYTRTHNVFQGHIVQLKVY